MKKILLVGLVLLVIIAGAVLYVYNSLDSLIIKAIEHYGTEMTGTNVRVADVDISMSTGRGTVRGLRVANPPGFSANDAFSLDQITLQLDLTSLGNNPLVISELSIDAPKVRMEVNEHRKSNLDVIRKNLDAYQGDSPAEPSGSQEEPMLMRVEDFRLSNGEITLTGVGKETVVAELPSVRKANLGGESGASGAEIGKSLLNTLIGAAVRAAAQSGFEKMLQEKLGGKAGKAARDVIRSILQ